jgi:hypothetical protein
MSALAASLITFCIISYLANVFVARKMFKENGDPDGARVAAGLFWICSPITFTVIAGAWLLYHVGGLIMKGND